MSAASIEVEETGIEGGISVEEASEVVEERRFCVGLWMLILVEIEVEDEIEVEARASAKVNIRPDVGNRSVDGLASGLARIANATTLRWNAIMAGAGEIGSVPRRYSSC